MKGPEHGKGHRRARHENNAHGKRAAHAEKFHEHRLRLLQGDRIFARGHAEKFILLFNHILLRRCESPPSQSLAPGGQEACP
jgi:hypothetical protein